MSSFLPGAYSSVCPSGHLPSNTVVQGVLLHLRTDCIKFDCLPVFAVEAVPPICGRFLVAFI